MRLPAVTPPKERRDERQSNTYREYTGLWQAIVDENTTVMVGLLLIVRGLFLFNTLLLFLLLFPFLGLLQFLLGLLLRHDWRQRLFLLGLRPAKDPQAKCVLIARALFGRLGREDAGVGRHEGGAHLTLLVLLHPTSSAEVRHTHGVQGQFRRADFIFFTVTTAGLWDHSGHERLGIDHLIFSIFIYI